ncbi:MAG TPA: Nif3-like dinuclear metal center hexameric protein [Gammaproteobacteria bacterium]|nr:Nif3-like dinuclear metal center hexameric protein [Gammaproteobacteria bacterium]
MLTTQELVNYCGELLDVDRFCDYCPNGLQVEGRSEVRRIISGVSASQALIEAAVETGADLLLVHHGYFWKGENATVTGPKRTRLKTLLTHDINLLVYHLPLDAHPQLGNNAVLGRDLGLEVRARFADRPGGPELACEGCLDAPVAPDELAGRLSRVLGRDPLRVGDGPAAIRRVGWCTGAAQSYLEAAARHGLDAFISGEISESTVHLAREYGIHYFAAGHHATERGGPRALGEHLAQRFGLSHQFVDIANPV